MVCDFKAHKERLATVAVSADKLWIFSASHDNVLKMYSLEEMSNVRTVSIGTRNISCCLPLPNNQTVLLGSWDHSICAYSVSFSLLKLHAAMSHRVGRLTVTLKEVVLPNYFPHCTNAFLLIRNILFILKCTERKCDFPGLKRHAYFCSSKLHASRKRSVFLLTVNVIMIHFRVST